MQSLYKYSKNNTENQIKLIYRNIFVDRNTHFNLVIQYNNPTMSPFYVWNYHITLYEFQSVKVHCVKYIDKKSLKILKGNQNPEIEDQATHYPKEKGQKDKQRSIKHYT